MPGRSKLADSDEARPMPKNYIKEWRRFRDRMTLERLAELTSYSISTINGIENGRYDFSGKSLLAIATALNIAPGALLDTNPLEDDAYLELGQIWRELGLQNRRSEAAEILRALAKTR